MGTPTAQLLEGAALPPRLRDLPAPPARLFLHGASPSGPCVGVVGTRRPTPEASGYAHELARALAARGVAIVSGGAKGIDAAAHRGALEAGGQTLVVAASSFDRPFPLANGELFKEIVGRGGGYLSRFEAGAPPRRHQFLERNGFLVALCHVLVLVEAPLRSGARNAAKWARRLSRPCFAVPSPPWNEQGRGCIAELKLGARPLGAPADVLRLLEEQDLRPLPPPAAASLEPAPGPPAPETGASARPLGAAKRGKRRVLGVPLDSELASAVLQAVRAGARDTEQVIAAVGGDAREVRHALMLLTLGGELGEAPTGELRVARR